MPKIQVKKCLHCGFDSNNDSIVAEGSPCGYRGCTMFVCCYDGWLNHLKEVHHLTDEEIERMKA